MGYIQGEYGITNIKKLTNSIFDMTIHCPQIAQHAIAGQFLHIRCGEKTLRRPISICEIDKNNGNIRIVFEIKGEGTLWLSQRIAGDMLDILGPLGNGFDLEKDICRGIFVGGGIGVPPLLEAAKNFNGSAVAILGFRTCDAAILVEDFEKVCDKVILTSDDGTLGFKGLVTDALRENSCCDIIYACGPIPMLKGVAAVAQEFGVECFVSLEERMGCGVGACLVCACKTADEKGEHYKHVCKDGPVFNAKEVAWL